MILDEPVSTLDEAAARELYRLLIERLPETILLSIDRRGVLSEFHTQALHMRRVSTTAAPARAPVAPAAVPA